MEDKYLPVGCDFYDQLTEIATHKKHIKVFYFDEKKEMMDAQGIIEDIRTLPDKSEVLAIGGQEVRLDKIVTVAGRPGPSYAEYDLLQCCGMNLPD
ncbi:hypothetical protein [Algivirga pacifica]|uniref:Rho-binding antiterminator n=1 Tax=Algivirga pacifica TaxID=1162670 RepID=A0ABP9DQV0_9BACT